MAILLDNIGRYLFSYVCYQSYCYAPTIRWQGIKCYLSFCPCGFGFYALIFVSFSPTISKWGNNCCHCPSFCPSGFGFHALTFLSFFPHHKVSDINFLSIMFCFPHSNLFFPFPNGLKLLLFLLWVQSYVPQLIENSKFVISVLLLYFLLANFGQMFLMFYTKSQCFFFNTIIHKSN